MTGYTTKPLHEYIFVFECSCLHRLGCEWWAQWCSYVRVKGGGERVTTVLTYTRLWDPHSELPPVHKLNVFNLRISMPLNEIATSTHTKRSELIYQSCLFHHEVFLFMTLKVLFMWTKAVKSIALFLMYSLRYIV